MLVHVIKPRPGADIDAVGENYKVNAWQRIVGEPPLNKQIVMDDIPVLLQREPDNQMDPNAVKVLVNREHVGYLPREVAEHVSPRLIPVEDVDALAVATGNLWYVQRDEGLKVNVKVNIPNDWVFDGTLDTAIYEDEKPAYKRSKLWKAFGRK